MKRLALCIALLFGLTMFASAQDTSTPATGKAPKGGPAAVKGPQKSPSAVEGDQDRRSLTGCVDKSGDGYILKNAKFKDGVAVHGSDDLAPHVGHTVTLSGTWATPGKDFSETKLKMVAADCNAKVSTSGKNKHKNATSTPPPQQ